VANALVLEGRWEEVREQAERAAKCAPGGAVRLTIEPLDGAAARLDTRDHFYRTATRSEWLNAFDAIGRMFPDLPVLPDAAYDRETIYEGRA